MRVSKLARSAFALVLLMLSGSVVCASSVGALAQSATAADPVQAGGPESVRVDGDGSERVTLPHWVLPTKNGRGIVPAQPNPLAYSVQYVSLETSPASSTTQSADANRPPHAEEQQRILNAALVPAVKRLGVPVKLVVNFLHVCDDWAFLNTRMRGAHGQAFSYVGTPEQQAAAHGLKSDSYSALLRRDRSDWNVIADAIGPTDVPWVTWSTRYHTPRAIFPTAVSMAGVEFASRCDAAVR